MMLDWNEYQKQIGKNFGELMKLSPDTVRGYRTLSDANASTSKLGEKTRQLISLAVAVTTRCDGCIVVHTEAALKAGATREEIAEALGVAIAMNAGAALVYSTRVSRRRRREGAPRHARIGRSTGSGRRGSKPPRILALEQIPQELVVNFVVELHFGHLHEGAELPCAAIRRGLLQISHSGPSRLRRTISWSIGAFRKSSNAV